MKLSDWKELVKKANIIHNNQYDYNKVSYINTKTPICIVCHKKDEDGNEHGEFWQIPYSHFSGQGCPKCGNRYTPSTEEWVKKAKKVHGDRYDYSKVEYKNNRTKVCIICHEKDKDGAEHGEFWQLPNNHISKHNMNICPICSKAHKLDRYEFIWKAIQKHGYKYDYSKVNYINNNTPVCIICPEHGEFWQTPSGHLNGRGCRLCGIIFLKKLFIKTTEQFIEKAKEIHGDRYDYSKVEYKGAFVKVCIICPIHGEFWQTPNSHINSKSGCILCNNINKSENDIAELLTNHNITFERQKKFDWLGNQRLDFYLPDYNIAIEYQGEQHYKPVKYFGGEKRYIDRKERDERKLLLCQQNNVDVLYISFFKLAPNNVLKDKNELINKIKEYEFIKKNN